MVLSLIFGYKTQKTILLDLIYVQNPKYVKFRDLEFSLRSFFNETIQKPNKTKYLLEAIFGDTRKLTQKKTLELHVSKQTQKKKQQ